MRTKIHYNKIAIYNIIILMLRLYNCTGSYIVKYRHSMPFGNIYTGGHFLGSREREKRQRPQNAAQVAVCRRCEHYAVFIGCQHQRCRHYYLGQGTGVPLVLENAPVSFAACPVAIFAALLREVDRSNTKLGENVKHLF